MGGVSTNAKEKPGLTRVQERQSNEIKPPIRSHTALLHRISIFVKCGKLYQAEVKLETRGPDNTRYSGGF